MICKHDKQYDLAIELTRIGQALESIIAVNKDSVSLLKKAYTSPSRKGKKAVKDLEDSCIGGLNAIMDKLLQVMKMTDKASYARWTFERNSAVKRHLQENDDFIYNSDDFTIIKESTTQKNIQDVLSRLPMTAIS